MLLFNIGYIHLQIQMFPRTIIFKPRHAAWVKYNSGNYEFVGYIVCYNYIERRGMQYLYIFPSFLSFLR